MLNRLINYENTYGVICSSCSIYHPTTARLSVPQSINTLSPSVYSSMNVFEDVLYTARDVRRVPGSVVSSP